MTAPTSHRLVENATAPDRGSEFAPIIGESASIRHAVHVARKIAGIPLRALVVAGETGTGKELLARCIHNAGPSADAPFITLDCAMLPPSVLDAELFGAGPSKAGVVKRGALEIAGRGTVFLADIGAMPLIVQAKLLQVLEEYSVSAVRRGAALDVPVQCRIIASSRTPLEDRVARGRFREDLLQRLSVLTIDLPPLRERDGDAQHIADHLLAEAHRANNAPRRQLGLDAVAAVRGHRWPGNVRELTQVIERALSMADGPLIGAQHLSLIQRRAMAAVPHIGEVFGEIGIPIEGKRLRDIEREALDLTLQLTENNQSAAARILCISRPTLARKLKEYKG